MELKKRDAKKYLDVGADKIILNTGAIEDPKVITKIAKSYGSQCVIVGIDFKRLKINLRFTHRVEKVEDVDPINWVTEVESLGAGKFF